MKKIDICISFNDVIPPKRVGFILNEGNKPSYYEQLLCLIKSIKLNWNKSLIDYEIYVHYSRPLDSKKEDELKNMECNLVFDTEETHQGSLNNRGNVYKHTTTGDYTLVLDTDTIVLNTPKFDFDLDFDFLVKTEPAKMFRNTPSGICNRDFLLELLVSHKIILTEDALPSKIKHFNNGLILVNNKVKSKYYDLHKNCLNLMLLEKSKFTMYNLFNANNKHYVYQHYTSFLISMCFSYGFYDSKKLNVFSKFYKQDSDTEIVHYLGATRKNGKGGFSGDIIEVYNKIMEC